MRNRKPLTKSAQVIAFLNSRALEDEQPLVAKNGRSTVPKKSKAKDKSTRKAS
jgi:hypothetical protein